jgi:hypothetical protein
MVIDLGIVIFIIIIISFINNCNFYIFSNFFIFDFNVIHVNINLFNY